MMLIMVKATTKAWFIRSHASCQRALLFQGKRRRDCVLYARYSKQDQGRLFNYLFQSAGI